jgi:hypothetical protein
MNRGFTEILEHPVDESSGKEKGHDTAADSDQCQRTAPPLASQILHGQLDLQPGARELSFDGIEHGSGCSGKPSA